MEGKAKDFLRDAFHSGALEVARDAGTFERFLSIFAGEMESLIAVQHHAQCFAGVRSMEDWLQLAQPNEESVRYFKGWLEREGAEL